MNDQTKSGLTDDELAVEPTVFAPDALNDQVFVVSGGAAIRHPFFKKLQRAMSLGTRRCSTTVRARSLAGEQFQPGRGMEGAHQEIHRHHSAERRGVPGRAKQIRRTVAQDVSQQRHH